MKQRLLDGNKFLTYVEDDGQFYLTEIEFSSTGIGATSKQLARFEKREEVEETIKNW